MKRAERGHLAIDSIRERLAANQGRDYWRSLDELAETEEFKQFLHDEFPGLSQRWCGSLNRRDLLKLMGASLALAGLSACTQQPDERIVPYVQAPEDFVPGKPLFFATAMPLSGYGRGVLAESHMGRPTKLEGNPEHPASLGSTDILTQASVLTLYDPDRSRAITNNGRISSWTSFLTEIGQAREQQRLKRGGGLRILTETITSPTLSSQIEDLLREFPEARWHQYEPAGADNARAGSMMAFGEYVHSYCRVEKADVILSIDSDFLTSGPASLRYAREWAARRNPALGRDGMNRLYVLESGVSSTGAVADHRLALGTAEIENTSRAIAMGLGVEIDTSEPAAHPDWVSAVVRDLSAHAGSSLVTVGETQSATMHALAHAMNHSLGNPGNTVIYTDPVEPRPVIQAESLAELVRDMDSGSVDLLVILGGNPAYNSPADIGFAEGLAKVKKSVHLSLYQDETSVRCHWHLTGTHYLEAWSDIRAYDGTTTIVQPLIAPLYNGKSEHELLSALQGQGEISGYETIRESWRERRPDSFDEFWEASLHQGFVAGTALDETPARMKDDWADAIPPTVARASEPGLELQFRTDPCIFDGRYANNGWLQELPKPLTKLTWSNAALLSPATAEKLDLQPEEVVVIRLGEQSLEAPVWLVPGIAENSVVLNLGYGREKAGQVGSGVGFDAYRLRFAGAPWSAAGVELEKAGRQERLACTQDHFSMEGRHLVREGTVEEYARHPEFVHEMDAHHGDYSLYPEWDYSGHKWGMSINLGACIGCNACVVACGAENNAAVVGKDEVAMGREMHWLRIDRYYQGDLENPSVHFQPVACMHCESAPCEVVCPVAATSHSEEGLNQMIYNRCVGTRYCSNNCPYKVRRFNFFQYSDWDSTSLKLMRNPDVTVRGRGVMEKCTYCVQRINRVKIEAKKGDRDIKDGEIVTACQAACPTRAISFGDLNQPESEVAELQSSPLSYGLLTELNVHPRTQYLAKIKNPNPDLDKD
jgi:molybdopterin-containing oxidoreductase family iron-sulfur binding subunit